MYSAYLQVEGLKMVVSNSTNLASCRSSFLSAMGQGVLISKEQTSSHDNVAEMISDLKVHIPVVLPNYMTFIGANVQMSIHNYNISYQ